MVVRTFLPRMMPGRTMTRISRAIVTRQISLILRLSMDDPVGLLVIVDEGDHVREQMPF